jgi:SAM-dependent methyltransferase
MSDANGRAQAVIDGELGGRRGLEVLEAGCGSASHVAIPPGAVLTGIDISESQLAANSHLNVKICGDLQTYRWPRDRFDLVICWDVLEHLPQPVLALRNLVEAVRSGGLLVLAVPNRDSLKGVLTRLTPYGFHLWFYRNVIGDRSPRLESRQFPTYLRPEVGHDRLRAIMVSLGCDVAHLELYEGPVQAALRERNRLAGFALSALGGAARAITFGRYDPNLTDMIMVLKKTRPDPVS